MIERRSGAGAAHLATACPRADSPAWLAPPYRHAGEVPRDALFGELFSRNSGAARRITVRHAWAVRASSRYDRRSVTNVSGTNHCVCAFVLRHDPYDSWGGKIMATDYDAPRRSEADELAEDSLDELKARRNEAQSGAVDVDESESAENFELPGADLSGEELTVKVLPKQADEFTCSSCFLVHHRSRLAEQRNGRMVCRDCAA
jgi:Domain of unknown function (DUF4193)